MKTNRCQIFWVTTESYFIYRKLKRKGQTGKEVEACRGACARIHVVGGVATT